MCIHVRKKVQNGKPGIFPSKHPLLRFPEKKFTSTLAKAIDPPALSVTILVVLWWGD